MHLYVHKSMVQKSINSVYKYYNNRFNMQMETKQKNLF